MYFTTISPCDSNMKCKCHGTRTCSPSGLIRMLRTRKEARLQIAPCHRKNSHQWKTDLWTSPLASNGRRTFRTNSTQCKRDIRRGRLERRSPLAQPKWCTHRKITGVQGAVLAGRMAQRPLLATYAIVGMTPDARRYPALARRRTRRDWFIRACTASRSPHQIHLQSQASIPQHLRDPKVLVAQSRAKAVHPLPAPTALLRRRPCGAVIQKATHCATHVVCS